MVSELRGIAGLALPIVIGLAASTFHGVVDSIMLGPLGAVPLAAAGLAAAASLIVTSAVWGTLSAVAVRAGQAKWARQNRHICAILRNGLALGAGVGVVAALAMALVWALLPWLGQPPEVIAATPGYWAFVSLTLVPFSISVVFRCTFEAVGRPWLGVAFASVSLGAKVPLNLLLIHGPGPLPPLGLMGAGLATLLAETLAAAVAWAYWRRARAMRRLRLRRPVLATEVASCAREGAPLGLLNMAETGAMAVVTLMIGTFGTAALAGNQVALSVGGVFYVLPMAFSGAVAVRVAQEQGAGRPDAMRAVTLAALGLAVGCMAVVGAIMWFGGRTIAAAIVEDPAVILAAAAIFAVFAPMQIADAVQSVMLGALRGLSDTAYPATVSMVAYWTLGLPLGWVIAHHLGQGAPGVWMGYFVALIGSALLLSLRFAGRTGLRGAAPAV
ncbi:MATE family efflux transporter [Rubellimicrobium roseum]|uniref:MATE family efflux transporter n=1 Tax=Rubellimicrobium roseum TaxID=687525 RepID=UPI0024832D4C|nr:MATE family efflux transporter [Rubellimicrobium roseum]